MSSKKCGTTTEDWKVLQSDISNIAVSIGDEIQAVTDYLDSCYSCGCADCTEHADFLKVRLGGLCDYVGRLQKELADLL